MLADINIESELSYAYLHAIASRGGFSCQEGNRHLDSAGVDAVIQEDGRLLSPDAVLTSFPIHIQLKATVKNPIEQNGKFSYSLSVSRYDKLRETRLGTPRILVVLYLPEEPKDWLCHSEDGLIAKRCAYWVSLHGAPQSDNPKYQTVYVPRRQVLSVDGLIELMTRFSRREVISYAT